MPEWKDRLTVHKYPVNPKGPFIMSLPKGTRIIHFGGQEQPPPQGAPAGSTNIGLFIWAIVDPTQTTEERRFWMVSTGEPFPTPKAHLGTLQLGPYVFHLMEMPDAPKPVALGIGEIDLPKEPYDG